MSRALVTGATGLLGARIVERLVAEGRSARGLVRDWSSSSVVEALGAEAVPGDLADPAAVRAAAAGCDAVFNAAAAIGPGSDHEAFGRVNVRGTENVITAAEAEGCRLVHVSSTAVFGRHRYRSTPTGESAALPDLPHDDAYGRSKQEAERLVLGAHARGRVRACVVRPTVMYGRRDRQFAPRLGPVLERGIFPLIGGGRARLTLVHADAVADGCLRAASSDRAGGRIYHLANDFDVTVAELVRFASQGLGRRVLAPRVPETVGRVAFGVLALLLTAAGRRDLAPHAEGLLQMLTRDNPFTSERARRELRWTPSIRPAEGVPDAFRWWKQSRDPAASAVPGTGGEPWIPL